MKNRIRAICGVMVLAGLVVQAADIDRSRRNAIVNAIEKAAPAVVTINVVEIRRQRVADDFFGYFNRPRFRGRAVEGIGTGFIFDEQGHILTNFHVLDGADAITSVTLPGGRELKVELIGGDKRSDLAVLRALGEGLPYIPLGTSKDLMIGEWSIAFGNPFGSMMRDAQPSVSVGVISAKERRLNPQVGDGERLYQGMIQTDAAINPGNSGGPLVNALGEVVGVNTMIFSSSGGHQGLGFAIPVDRAKRIAAELIEHGRRRDPWFGFRGHAVQSLTPYAREELGLTVDTGVFVVELARDCPVSRAGLALGDVVLAINGEAVNDPQEVDYINWDLYVGDRVRIKVDRQGQLVDIKFQIEEIQ